MIVSVETAMKPIYCFQFIIPCVVAFAFLHCSFSSGFSFFLFFSITHHSLESTVIRTGLYILFFINKLSAFLKQLDGFGSPSSLLTCVQGVLVMNVSFSVATALLYHFFILSARATTLVKREPTRI